MSLSGIFARIVALIGAAALLWRRLQGAAPKPAWGSAPVVPVAKPQGAIPTLKMPTARGWTDGQIPVAAPGLKVNAFAIGLKHPRWIHVLPNGDVLVAESNQVAGPTRGVFTSHMVKGNKRQSTLNSGSKIVALDADQCSVSPVAVTRARAASSARTLRMMNRLQPSQANGFRFRRARRLFFCVAAVFMRILRF